MPELPEVETIARLLREGSPDSPSILGDQIIRMRLLWPRTLTEPGPVKARRFLQERFIQAISRRGKFLVVDLDGLHLLIHLRMSGDLLVREADALLAKHDRMVLWLTGKSGERQLVFNDARKFGRVWVTANPARVLGALGPEPLDECLDNENFHCMLTERQRLLKPLLLDQKFLAGMGNIYTDEALHLACLHPLRNSASLSQKESERLLVAIREVLREGIRRNGASIDWVYRGGEFQNHFRVYGREGEPCPVCGTPITRLLVGQRGTHVCEMCQPR